jgi:putative hydrolase of the HAD superfamily
MATLSAVAFDLDGTLLDHRTASARALAHLVRSLGGSVPRGLEQAWWNAEDRHLDEWRRGRISFDEQRRSRLRDVLPLIGSGYESAGDEQLDGIFRTYLGAYEAAWCLFPEVVEVLDAVRSAGLPLGVLTNGTEEQQVGKLAATGILDRFAVVRTSEALGVSKPDARAFDALCARLGVPPAEVLFVGDDHRADIQGARAAGLRTYFVDRRGDAERDEPGHADLRGLLSRLS